MITADDRAKINVQHVIFHDVPANKKGEVKLPTLAEAPTEIDATHKDMLKHKLVSVLGSKSAYDIQFDSESSSPLPKEVPKILNKKFNEASFVSISQKFAKHLHSLQDGTMSPGLLCVIDLVSGGRRGLAILKLERERGVDLQLSKINGKNRFAMSVLDNLVFTDGTKLFKSSLFLKSGDSYLAAACENQRPVTSSDDIARYWLRFLGCTFTEEPRITTQRWFNATIQFVNSVVTDATTKNDLYEHLLSELKSNKKRIEIRSFIENYIPDNYRTPYKRFLADNNISLQNFNKDISDIKNKLNRKYLRTREGVIVTVPADKEDLVNVQDESILISDQLQNIATS